MFRKGEHGYDTSQSLVTNQTMTLRSNCLTLKESRFKFQVIHALFTLILWDALKKEDLILSIRHNIESKK